MKIAIIGASYGQLPLCLKAKEMGLKTICFAWEEGAICRNYVDKFYPISVSEKDRILEICREENVDGVVSNASDYLAEIVAFLSEQLNLVGNSAKNILLIKDKYYVRNETLNIPNLKQVRFLKFDGSFPPFYPCVVKPVTGAAKRGVYFVSNAEDFLQVIEYTKQFTEDIIIEEYISGREFSVETISFKGNHYMIQITEKENSGPPHFVELAHHQPADLYQNLKDKIAKIVEDILKRVGFENGAAHIEIKIDCNGNVYLIEVNPRGGGDEISSCLVELSTGYDYIKAIIEVALNVFKPFDMVSSLYYSGIYFLCNQTKDRLKFFEYADNKPWLVKKNIKSYELMDATGNYDRNGYVIYKSNHKIDCYNDSIM